MSWYGSHPKVSKERARAVLPPVACRRCVYFARLLPQMKWMRDEKTPHTCPSCGIIYVAAEVIRRLALDAAGEEAEKFIKEQGAERCLLAARRALLTTVGTLEDVTRRRIQAILDGVRGHSFDFALWTEVSTLFKERAGN